VHAELSLKKADPLEAEHEMIDCLGEALWQAQQNGGPPDENALMQCLKEKLER
jgi:predicted Rdx family selenoprotein